MHGSVRAPALAPIRGSEILAVDNVIQDYEVGEEPKWLTSGVIDACEVIDANEVIDDCEVIDASEVIDDCEVIEDYEVIDASEVIEDYEVIVAKHEIDSVEDQK